MPQTALVVGRGTSGAGRRRACEVKTMGRSTPGSTSSSLLARQNLSTVTLTPLSFETATARRASDNAPHARGERGVQKSTSARAGCPHVGLCALGCTGGFGAAACARGRKGLKIGAGSRGGGAAATRRCARGVVRAAGARVACASA
eukprot:571212-Pleurochrysis_carterae.AAC.1